MFGAISCITGGEMVFNRSYSTFDIDLGVSQFTILRPSWLSVIRDQAIRFTSLVVVPAVLGSPSFG